LAELGAELAQAVTVSDFCGDWRARLFTAGAVAEETLFKKRVFRQSLRWGKSKFNNPTSLLARTKSAAELRKRQECNLGRKTSACGPAALRGQPVAPAAATAAATAATTAAATAATSAATTAATTAAATSAGTRRQSYR
ncbi:Hypothetical predicted protein, partial [Olea europaea subsp. europaea]